MLGSNIFPDAFRLLNLFFELIADPKCGTQKMLQNNAENMKILETRAIDHLNSLAGLLLELLH